MKTRLHSRLTRVDIAALLVFAAVWVYYIFMVRYGVNMPDEGFYIGIAERFVHGDRPLVDEWHVSQIAHILLCLPYKLFVMIKGSTDGIILFFRYLFLTFNALFYWCMYNRLRTYGWLDLIATFLFGIYVPAGIYSCNYYTVAVRLLMIVCLILFSERQKPLSLLFAGILFACSVLSEIGFALLYFGYSLLVLVCFLREKKGKRFLNSFAFCLRLHVWIWFSLGILFSAVIFSVWLFARSGLQNILTVLPSLFLTDPEYDYSSHGGAWFIFFRKVINAVQFYGTICVSAAVLITILSIAYACRILRDRRGSAQKILFFCACIVWILSCVQTLRHLEHLSPSSFFFMCPLTMFWFGIVCFLLCEQKKKRFLFFWIVGLFSSLCVDFLSDASLAVGCPIAYIADLIFFADLTREIRTEKPEKKITSAARLRERNSAKKLAFFVRWSYRLICVCFAAWIAFIFGIGNAIFPEHHLVGTPISFSAFSCRCEKGPCQSLYYPEEHLKNYYDKLADIDTLKKSEPKNLFVFGMAPDLYLYADLPYSTCCAWTWRNTAYLDRHLRYWQLCPEKLPDCIYFPTDLPYNEVKNTEELLAWVQESFDPLCEYSLDEGQGGYILYVSRWKPEIKKAG